MDQFIKKITKEAGRIVARKFGKVGVKYKKLHALDVVTQADLASNKYLVDAIRKKYPHHGIISEETGEYQKDAEYVWIIDPLDGTLNFSKHIPMYVVLVALARNGKVELSAVSNPASGNLYFARRGKGVFLNGKRIQCSAQKKIANSLGSINSRVTSPEPLKFVNNLSAYLNGDRCWTNAFGCMGLNIIYVADGRTDWFVSSASGNVWDYAAPYLVAKEAGCIVTNLKGQEWSFSDRQMVVANKKLHAELMKVISGEF